MNAPIVTQHEETTSRKGAMKVSPDGNKLAVCYGSFHTTTEDTERAPGAVYLFDFDINSGSISNQLLPIATFIIKN